MCIHTYTTTIIIIILLIIMILLFSNDAGRRAGDGQLSAPAKRVLIILNDIC